MTGEGAGWQWLAAGWADWMAAMAWQVALLAAIVWLVTKLVPRSSASFRYAVWLLVFVRLMLPPSLSAPWSAGNVLSRLPFAVRLSGIELDSIPAARSDSRASIEMQQERPSDAESPAGFPMDRPAADTSTRVPSAGSATSLPVPVTSSWQYILGTMMAVWAAIALTMLTTLYVQFRRFRRRMLAGSSIVTGPLRKLAEEHAERLRLHRRFDLRSSPHLQVPAVLRLQIPIVLLPEHLLDTLPREQIGSLICHELAHVKRRDIELSWAASLLLCIYWFHPAAWLANVYLRREREMACDDKVLYTTRQDGHAYAATILRVAESFDSSVPAGAGLLGLLEIADNLLQRVRSISDVTRRRRAGLRSVVFVAAMAALLLPMGVWTAASFAEESLALAAQAEIERSYAQANQEVRKYIVWTAEHFGPQGLWLPEDTFDALPQAERAAKVAAVKEALEGPGALEAYTALAEAGALADASLLPGLVKVAWYMQEGGQDNRSKWMALVALGRIGDPGAVPVLIPLVDHYNTNTRMWAQASLVRLTGQNFETDTRAWAKWANTAGPLTAIAPAVLEWASRQSQARMKDAEASEPASATQAAPDLSTATQHEIREHYTKADSEVQEYIRWTAHSFGRSGLWQPVGAFDGLSPEEREKKVVYAAGVLDGDYGRHLCTALADAGALKDPRLIPGLVKVACYHRDDSDYDCRPKWMAVAALGRQDDQSVVPVLIPLIDHGNQNTRMWARASLARLTHQNFGDDKQAWAKWWNDAGKQPPIDASQLKPWTPPAGVNAPIAPAGQVSSAVPEGSKGPQKGALRFDGTDDLIHIPPALQLDLTKNFTVSAWVNVHPGCGESAIYFRGDAQRAHDPCQLTAFDGTVAFAMYGGDGEHDHRLFISADFKPGWHYWSAVCDNDAGKVYLYRDGRQVAEAPAPPPFQYATATMYNEIGSIDSGAWGGWGFFKGELDQISVWNLARSADDIQRDFADGITGNEPGLAALWTFDEEGQTILDASPSKCNVTLGRSPEPDPSDPTRFMIAGSAK